MSTTCNVHEWGDWKGDAEQVLSMGKEGENWHIPYHAINHPKKTEKLRVVFDFSAKYKGTSLNNHLLSGPDMTNNLFRILFYTLMLMMVSQAQKV